MWAQLAAGSLERGISSLGHSSSLVGVAFYYEEEEGKKGHWN